MRDSNVKIFTACTYLLLLILIIGSVVFLVAQRIQLAKQAQTYASQIIEHINNSYITNGSFTTATFTKDVKDAMQGFGDLIRVITIVDSQNIMHNRFRFDSINLNKDPNPNWQNEIQYRYNPLLYEEQNYPLYIPGQVRADIRVLYQRLPAQLIRDVLQFDTVVILALLILSFLAFLVIPKRDPAETAWALRSVIEEDEMHQEENKEPRIDTDGSWFSQDLPETNWEDDNWRESIQTPDGDESDPILNSSRLDSSSTHIDPDDDPIDDMDTLASLKDVDLSFNEYVVQDTYHDEKQDEGGDEKKIDGEDGIDLAARQPSAEIDTEEKSDPITSNPQEFSDELPNLEELYLGDELIDDLDEGLGDDSLEEPIDQDIDANIFSQLAMSASVELQERASSSDTNDNNNESLENHQESDNSSRQKDSLSSLNEEHKQEILTWMGNFLQKANHEVENNTPDLSVALLETTKLDIDIVRASLEQDLESLKASILPNDKGMVILLPSKNISDGIEELQNAASRLPASYLKNLKMGITGISAARNNIDPSTIFSEIEYALANCDEINNISIFDANDQVFNQQHSQA